MEMSSVSGQWNEMLSKSRDVMGALGPSFGDAEGVSKIRTLNNKIVEYKSSRLPALGEES